MKSWKRLEREVAKAFGGVRRIRIYYSERAGDIIHKRYSIECKYGKQVPKYLIPEVPTYLIPTRSRERYFLVPSNFLVTDTCLTHSIGCEPKRRNGSISFLENAMEQARQYNPDLRPIVCVKVPNLKGFIAIWEQ